MWIEEKLSLLVATDNLDHKKLFLKTFASFLVVFSGLILFTEKITTFGITETYGYNSTKTFIWVLCQTLSPILLCFGAFLRPYRLFYFIPVYIYFIQLFWIFNPETYYLDDPLLHVYAFGFCLGAFCFLLFVIFIAKKASKTNQILLKNIRKATRFLVIEVRKKWIPEDKKKDYTKELVRFNESLETLD